MASYMIGYDLLKPGQNYDSLFKAIKDIGSWWHCLNSTWIVKSGLTAKEVRDRLTPYIDANDHEGAWRGFGQACSDWLKNNL